MTREDLEATSLHTAAKKGDVDVMRKLLNEDVNLYLGLSEAVNGKGGLLKNTPLHVACEEGDLKMAKFLLINEADVFAKDSEGCEPIHIAADGGHSAIVEVLIERGAMVNNRNKRGESALHWASCKGRADVVNVLLRKGADVKAKSKKGWTALHFAVISCKHVVVETLLNFGVDINAQTTMGNTPLHIASASNNVGLVDLLVKYSANKSLLNVDGGSPGDLANKDEIREILGWRPGQKVARVASLRESDVAVAEASAGDASESPASVLETKTPAAAPIPKHVIAEAQLPFLRQDSPMSFQDQMKLKAIKSRERRADLDKEKDKRDQGMDKFLKKYNLAKAKNNLFLV